MIKTLHQIIQCINRGFPIRAALFCEINFTNLPRSTIIGHPFGIVIGEDTKFGENCIIRQNVTIGRRMIEKRPRYEPNIIGNNVEICSGAIIIGEGLTIGDNSIIGAGSIVLKNVPPNTKVVGVYK